MAILKMISSLMISILKVPLVSGGKQNQDNPSPERIKRGLESPLPGGS
jgi:hypothetical protein